MRSLFTTVVWGKDYVEHFLRACVPTMLTAGNLGAASHDSRFLIVTTKEDAKEIQDAAIFTPLSEMIDVEFLIIPRPKSGNKYLSVSREQTKAIRRSLGYDALFFIYPDFVFSEGSIGHALQRLETGHRAVVLPVPRVLDHRILAEFRRLTAPGQPGLALPPREFTALATRCLHPSMAAYEWSSRQLSSYPSTLFWRTAPNAMLYRCFHLHPLAIKVQPYNPSFNTSFRASLDEEYLPRLFPDIDGIYCVSDSDEAAICSLSPANFEVHRLLSWQNPDVLFLARWAEGATSTLHRQFARHAYHWHSESVDPVTLQEITEQSWNGVRPVLERLSILGENLRIEDPLSYSRRHQRLRRFAYWHGLARRAPVALDELPTSSLSILFAARLARLTRTTPIALWIWHTYQRLKGRATGQPSPLAAGHLLTEGVATWVLCFELYKRTFHENRSTGQKDGSRPASSDN